MVSVFFYTVLLFVCMFVFSFCALPFWCIKMFILHRVFAVYSETCAVTDLPEAGKASFGG